MPYYPHIGSDAAQPNGTTGDVAIATDSMKLRLNVSGTWYEAGQSVGMLTLGGTVAKHELLGYSSGWVRAANTAGSIIAAQYIALKAGVSGDVIPVAKRAVVSGSFTADAEQYLGTAGAITATRPTTDASLRQRVGRAISTSQASLEIRGFREVAVPLVTTGATSAYALLDSGNFGGPTLDANTETLTLFGIIPENAVSLVIAKLHLAAEAYAGTPTMDITVGSSVDGVQHDAVTADATLTNKSRAGGAAADEYEVLDITLGFDATNIFRPGAGIGVKCTQDDGGTDISFVFGGTLIILVAD